MMYLVAWEIGPKHMLGSLKAATPSSFLRENTLPMVPAKVIVNCQQQFLPNSLVLSIYHHA